MRASDFTYTRDVKLKATSERDKQTHGDGQGFSGGQGGAGRGAEESKGVTSTATEGGLPWDGERTTQCTDDGSLTCTLETYMILLTDVTPIDVIKKQRHRRRPILLRSGSGRVERPRPAAGGSCVSHSEHALCVTAVGVLSVRRRCGPEGGMSGRRRGDRRPGDICTSHSSGCLCTSLPLALACGSDWLSQPVFVSDGCCSRWPPSGGLEQRKCLLQPL